mgnify:FL=1
MISQEIGANIVRKVKTQHIDLELMDFIVAEHSRLKASEIAWGVYEIIGTQKNLSSAEVTLTMRHVRDYTFPSWSYLQGIIWGHKIFGHKIHSVTTYTRA